MIKVKATIYCEHGDCKRNQTLLKSFTTFEAEFRGMGWFVDGQGRTLCTSHSLSEF